MATKKPTSKAPEKASQKTPEPEPIRGKVGVILSENEWYALDSIYKALRGVHIEIDNNDDTDLGGFVEVIFDSLHERVMKHHEQDKPEFYVKGIPSYPGAPKSAGGAA